MEMVSIYTGEMYGLLEMCNIARILVKHPLGLLNYITIFRISRQYQLGRARREVCLGDAGGLCILHAEDGLGTGNKLGGICEGEGCKG